VTTCGLQDRGQEDVTIGAERPYSATRCRLGVMLRSTIFRQGRNPWEPYFTADLPPESIPVFKLVVPSLPAQRRVEWEKAARGGVSGRRFPWSDTDTIQHARANYYSDASYSYDTSPTRGYHPTFDTGGYPNTSPVGYFAPNGYGFFDMAGNA